LVPVHKQAGAFSPALLVPVATTGTNVPYKPGLKAFFPPVILMYVQSNGLQFYDPYALRFGNFINKFRYNKVPLIKLPVKHFMSLKVRGRGREGRAGVRPPLMFRPPQGNTVVSMYMYCANSCTNYLISCT
jgi:hypothetical protein